MRPQAVLAFGLLFCLASSAWAQTTPVAAPISTVPVSTPAEIEALNQSITIRNKYYEVLQWIQVSLLILSILGSFFTILTFVIFSSIRSYPIKLICWLCSTIFIGQLLFLTVQFLAPNTFFCTYGGALVHYFFLTNFFWCFCLAFNFYQLIVKRNSVTRELEKWYHLIGWGVSLVFVLIVAGLGVYGQQGPNGACYIVSRLAVFLGFFLPGLLMVSANCVLFFFVASEIHGTLSKAPETEQRRKDNSKEMRVLISIFVTVGLSWAFGFFVALTSDVDILREIMQLLFSLTAPLQGFFIFVAYCINKKVLNRWKGLFGCKVRGDESTSRTASSRGGGTGATASRSGQSSRVD